MRCALALPCSDAGTRLRPLRMDDLAAFAAYRADPQIATYQSWEPMSFAQAEAFVRAVAGVTSLVPGEWTQLAIADTTTDRLLGDIGLYLADDGAAGELGFTLAREHQGRGHATRAAGLALGLLFADPLVAEVRAVTDARNAASIAVLQRAGFARVGQRHAVFKARHCTEVIFHRTREPA